MTAELHFFPFFAKDWLSSRSVRRMTREERGDFIDLLCFAFGNGSAEPSLESSDFGPASDRVKAQFVERDGRFYNETLSRAWVEAQGRHAQAVKRGKRSGVARRQRKRLETVSKQSSNGVEQPPLGLVIESGKDSLSRGAGALAAEAPRPAPEERRNGEAVLLSDMTPTGILRMAGVPR